MSAESGKIRAKLRGIGYLVTGILLLGVASPAWWSWISDLIWTRGYDLHSPLLRIAIMVSAATFVPPVLLLVAYFLSRNRRRGKAFHGLIVGCTVAGVLLGLLCSTFPETMVWGWHVTNPKRYQEMLRTFPPSGVDGLANHFPRAIPSDATHVRFSCGHVMQGGIHLQLRVKVPPEEVEAILAKYQPKALAIYPPTREQHYEIGPYFHTGDAAETQEQLGDLFPRNYQILYLGPFSPEETRRRDISQIYPCDRYGLAVDVSASEVIYWAEAW